MKWTVEYDEITEAYIVQITPDCFAEVMGRGRKSQSPEGCAGLDPRTKRVIPLFDLSEWGGSDVASME